MRETLTNIIINNLTILTNAREHEASYPIGCKPIVPGVTHCKSCGFHYSTSVAVATWRNLCKSPKFHVQELANYMQTQL